MTLTVQWAGAGGMTVTSVTANPSLPAPGSSPTVPVDSRGGHRVERDLDINSDWITQQPELLFRTSI